MGRAGGSPALPGGRGRCALRSGVRVGAPMLGLRCRFLGVVWCGVLGRSTRDCGGWRCYTRSSISQTDILGIGDPLEPSALLDPGLVLHEGPHTVQGSRGATPAGPAEEEPPDRAEGFYALPGGSVRALLWTVSHGWYAARGGVSRRRRRGVGCLPFGVVKGGSSPTVSGRAPKSPLLSLPPRGEPCCG